MRKMRILAAIVLVALAIVGWVPRRSRAATCYGSSCNGLDPITTGCSADASVVNSAPVLDPYDNELGTVYYKWSATCQAGYAVTVTAEGTAAVINARIWSSSADYYNIDQDTDQVTSPLLSAGSLCDLYATGFIRIDVFPGGSGYAGSGCEP